MFRDDFEFNDQAGPSHHHGSTPHDAPTQQPVAQIELPRPATQEHGAIEWLSEAERELKKIPFFVRGKARRNTEQFALDHGLPTISLETLYEAKAYYAK
jgi:light-independent protochlorophyllide reductase subunit B